ncbi:MAG: AAA family ATPase [Polyangiaceae bacterium]|nr:AAA family ATPase [Polyangiaceae bacterium]
MTIVKFAFEDRLRKWNLEPTEFSPFNLLVGASGVGKTRILESLNRVRLAATKGARRVPDCSWTLIVEASGQRYTWKAQTGGAQNMGDALTQDDEDDNDTSGEGVRFVEEELTSSDGVIVSRTPETFIFNGEKLPQLKDTDSAIELLRREEVIKPLHLAMQRFLFSGTHQPIAGFVPFDKQRVEKVEARVGTFDDLRDDSSGLTVLAKAVIMQNKFAKEFATVVGQYREIFDQVEEVRVGPLSEFEKTSDDLPPFFPMEWITVALRERQIDGWLVHHRVSSGMLRTLIHLFELALAPTGTVVLIDEFENSLGVNCLPQVADRLVERSKDLQFFVTSHHPYVINNIPWNEWRVVVRKGTSVRVLTSSDIPALHTASSHDRFTILSNLPEFERGIQ